MSNNQDNGNVAVMRETLKAVVDSATTIMSCVRKKRGPIFNIAKCLIVVVKSALAAPPRNCDRFGGDIDRLREACLRERGLNPEEDFPEVFCEWLLSKAKGRKP